MPDPDVTEEIEIAHAIKHKFQFSYRDQWVPQKTLFQKDRKWVKVFNKMVDEGLIMKKKTFQGYQFRWAGGFF